MHRGACITTWYGIVALAALATASRPALAYGDRDRKENYEDASKEGKEKTDKQLPPQMMMHLMKKANHDQKAQEMRQQQDNGGAEQEEMKGQMEQMKAQQLQKQIDENHKSAAKNTQNAKLLQDDEATKKTAADINRVIVDQTRLNQQPSSSGALPAISDRTSTKPSPADDVSPILEPQLARLDDFSRDKMALSEKVEQMRAVETKADPAAEPGKSWQRELDQVGTRNNNIGFNDAAPSSGTTSAGANGSMTPTGAAPQNRLLSAAGEPTLTSELPSAIPALVKGNSGTLEEKKEKEAKDKEFWAAVDGKKKKKKKGSLARGSGRKGSEKGVVRLGNVDPRADPRTQPPTKP